MVLAWRKPSIEGIGLFRPFSDSPFKFGPAVYGCERFLNPDVTGSVRLIGLRAVDPVEEPLASSSHLKLIGTWAAYLFGEF
jgi:hypothetical protein